MKIKENKGITLIALVITIIVLLILAGVTIGMLLGENGLITKALKAAKEQKKAQYFEEINLEITTEKTERLASPKEELFILSVRNRISGKEWAKSVSMAKDEEGNLDEITTDEQAENANVLILLTKDGYEIFVDVDNAGLTASIRDSFEKAGKTYKVKYNKNGGSGEDPEEREVRAGFSIKLPESPYEGKNGYVFVGWADNKNGEGTVYAEGSYYKPEKDVTLYATWSKEIVDIEFNGNATGVSGSMEMIQVKRGQEIALTTNAFVREGYRFVKWNTQVDGQGTDYENGATITTNDDITLYAVWAKQIVATLSINNGKKLTEGTTFTIGATAQSSDIETITVTVGDQTVYSEELPAETKTYNKAISIDSLNNVDKLLFNETYNAKIRVTSSSEDPKENTVTGVKNYTIGSAVSLNALASAVNRNNTFSGETIYQIANVTTTANYEPIGYYDAEGVRTGPYFAGIYKGNQKTINLTSITTNSKFKSSGIFGMTKGANISDLIVKGENSNAGSHVGGIIGAAFNTQVNNCVNNCKITSTSGANHGRNRWKFSRIQPK